MCKDWPKLLWETNNASFAFLKEEAEDIYSITDGKPLVENEE